MKYIKTTITSLLLLTYTKLFAHVKWFSNFNFLDKSREISEVIDITYVSLSILTIFVISLIVILDKKIKNSFWSIKLTKFINNKQKYANDVIRIAMFAVLIISWVNDKILTPELEADSSILPWLEFLTAILLLFRRTVNLGGVLILALYVLCFFKFGFFYMLDYYHFIGIAVYLVTSNSKNIKIRSIGVPALYITLGLGLIWLAYEKLYYPSWGLHILNENPILALGFPHEFFLKASAFIEIGLGFMLIFGGMERPLAAVITVVFILTALVFGKIEVIGHTPLHAMLIVFILKGTSDFYKPPIERIRRTYNKIILASISYISITSFGLIMYKEISDYQYQIAKEKSSPKLNNHCAKMIDVSLSKKIPKILTMNITEEPKNMGYNLYVELKNWKFTPNQVGQKYKENQGHIHVYINGKKAGRMYSNWFYLGKLTKGTHKISITINGDDHTAFTIGNKIIGSEKKILIK